MRELYFAGLIFVVFQSTAKTAKIGPLENFPLYGNLVGIADGSRHAIAIKQDLCCLLCSACLYTTVNSWIGILTLKLMLLPTQLTFLNRCPGSTCFFLGVIHKIFQVHLGASYPRLSWLVKSYGNLTHAARSYRVKLQHQGYTARHTTDDLFCSSCWSCWKKRVTQTSYFQLFYILKTLHQG